MQRVLDQIQNVTRIDATSEARVYLRDIQKNSLRLTLIRIRFLSTKVSLIYPYGSIKFVSLQNQFQNYPLLQKLLSELKNNFKKMSLLSK
jgi:hypothetical protein